MIDLYPNVRQALKANSYFASFLDDQQRFKAYKEDEAPATAADQSPYIRIEQGPAKKDRRSGWGDPYVTFYVTGKDTQWATLWEIARKIEEIFSSLDALPAAGDIAGIQYALIGDSLYDKGRDPVTDEVTVSVALQFGVET